MPVLPLVGSRSSRPGSSSPARSAASTIERAMRSLIEPVGFWPSSFAKSRTSGLGLSRGSSTSGVFPTRSSSPAAVAALDTGRPAGHGGEQDDRRRIVDGGVEAVLGADVLALDVDVHERCDVLVLEEL